MPAEGRQEEDHKKTAKKSATSSAPAPKPPSSSSSSDSEEEVLVEEHNKSAQAQAKASSLVPAPAPVAAVPVWLQGRVDSLTRKAAVFSRALTRASQALRTSARIAREAAQSFEAELENFQLAQREVDKEFGQAAESDLERRN